MLSAVLDVAERVPEPARQRLSRELQGDLHARLVALLVGTHDEDERRRVRATIRRLAV